ncbi:NTPase KAP family P-loop domain-containing protein 1 [Callorhinchus milii]|uniref:NTPase KAP family P-loop domain-containing protein 1-like n=1 Tax=Callorhinchus milii TaxID=7868 RepID=A0A4W3GHU8_CALMI|nr:NTPase KAP family P-loop domain-containing protein 1 [Callorhinchus milii]XP_007882918.1 NTPase KAP family P-loop domain-containing protein 1 [Callorhinchus milii]|eukprot:gi/632988093/ref/XP_007882917.1/ PREDICTED: NTPase KAP family P-loop domain-containing protein 1-like [Callorhinchus milii]
MTISDTADQTKYDDFAICLADGMFHIPTPVTVGLYAPWGCRINRVLQKIEGHMTNRAKDFERQQKAAGGSEKGPGETPRRSTGLGFVDLLFRFLCLNPRLTPQHEGRKNIRFIFVNFSAWQFAGSDFVWAGLITTLCDTVKSAFGNIPLSIVRALGADIGVSHKSKREWDWKTLLGIPIWIIFPALVLLIILLVVLFVVGSLLVFDEGNKIILAFESVGAGVLGCSTVVLVKNILMVVKNMLYSQKDTVNSLMNKTNYSAQLGFMSDVKNEVKVLTNFIRYMEIFERRKIRIILKIVNLDRCTPDKVVGVLDAMNILLSDPEAPFISILAVDPSIIASCVERSSRLKGVADNGYVYLNRIITLPFCIPEMDTETKLITLKGIINRKTLLSSRKGPSRSETDCEGSGEERIPLVEVKEVKGRDEVERQILKAYDCLEHLQEFIEENYLEMRRIVNSVNIMVRLMAARGQPLNNTLPRLVAWVILTSHWPTKFSWISQCLEDMQQTLKEVNEDKSLLSIYEESYDELKLAHEEMDKFLELDGDPELFHTLLEKLDFKIQDSNQFLPYTINIDPSLKRKMELLRGKEIFGRKQINKDNVKPFTVLQVLRMDAKQVCEKMEEINLLEYSQKVMAKNLNGRTFIYSYNNEIREALEMTSLSDWATFKVYFLQARQQPLDSTLPDWLSRRDKRRSGQPSSEGDCEKVLINTTSESTV